MLGRDDQQVPIPQQVQEPMAVFTQADTNTPTPQEAARGQARFKEDVQVKRRSPLLSSPPKQKPPVR